MIDLEILSPAGDMEALKAAVFNGANSVYLGVKQFNARNNIVGFSLETLKTAVDFAHIFNVKVYLTVNILFKDTELQGTLDLIFDANNIGVDAFIIQDLGLANLVHKTYPSVQIHASTQMAVHNLEGAKICKDIGFSRVVLARETSLNEIKRIKENLDIELEYFVQGALCVSFSGNCYMCSHLKNKSGNRGECLQFCRLNYKLTDGSKNLADGYLLSAKDICNFEYLQKMKDAGVDCIKIEGRARRPYYVAVATNFYKKALNKTIDTEKDFQSLNLAFNREFTPAYFNGNGKIISKIQGHNGIKIGNVNKVKLGNKFNEIFIETKYQLHPKSSLKFVRDNTEQTSINAYDLKEVNGGFVTTTTNNSIKQGDNVSLLSDETLEQEVLNKTKKVKIALNIVALKNKEITIKAIVNDTKYQHLGCVLQEAKSAPLSLNDVEVCFLKNEYFEPKITFETDGVFVAKSVLNQIRRDFYDELTQKLLNDYLIKNKILKIEKKCLLPKIIKNTNKIVDNIKVVDTVSQLKNAVSDVLIFDPYNYSEEDIKTFATYKNNSKKYLSLPNFVEKDDINFLMQVVEKYELGIVVNNLYALTFNAPKIAGGFLNVYNSYTVNFLQSFGIDIFYTKELNDNEINDICKNTGAYILKDKKHYMTLKHCPFKQFLNSTCNSCKFKDGLTYTLESGEKFLLTRKKVKTCTFYLEDAKN